jgi:hypothetical protein
MIESPEEASEIACPMVLHAVVADMQLLLSLPLTPLTYHVLAEAGELIRHKAMSSNVVVKAVCFTIVSPWSRPASLTQGATRAMRREPESQLQTRLGATGLTGVN